MYVCTCTIVHVHIFNTVYALVSAIDCDQATEGPCQFVKFSNRYWFLIMSYPS